MSRRCIVGTIVLLACAMWLAGCAAQSEPVVDQHSYWKRLAMSLKESKQPREQALAARLLVIPLMDKQGEGHSVDATTVADLTVESAVSNLLSKVNNSDDAVALSLATQAGVHQQDQQVLSSSAARWQVIEPDNLAARLYTNTPIENVLARARDTTRYETHAYDHIRLMTSVFKRWPMTRQEMGAGYANAIEGDEARAGVMAFGIGAAFGIPGFQKLSNACRDDALLSERTRRNECLHVAKVMAGNPSDLLSEGIGISMLERAAITPEDIA